MQTSSLEVTVKQTCKSTTRSTLLLMVFTLPILYWCNNQLQCRRWNARLLFLDTWPPCCLVILFSDFGKKKL